jgi:hypothetical protein
MDKIRGASGPWGEETATTREQVWWIIACMESCNWGPASNHSETADWLAVTDDEHEAMQVRDETSRQVGKIKLMGEVGVVGCVM